MTLYSDPASIHSHRVRIVLFEKDITVEIEDVDPDNKPDDLLHLNPYNTVPTSLIVIWCSTIPGWFQNIWMNVFHIRL